MERMVKRTSEKTQNNYLQKTKKQSIQTENINLQTITIQTPTVNEKGEIIKTDSYEIKYFREILPNGMELDMISIPGGTFWMGDDHSYASYRHQVTVPSFYMAKYPITQEQWRAIAQLQPINRNLTIEPAYFPGDKRPIENISWLDAVEFCQRLSHLTNRNYQLPSEAQWEYACRAETTTSFHFGEKITRKLANYNFDDVYRSYVEETTGVGTFFPNAFGLYDMHGNVWEWCLDDWRSTYYGNEITDGSAFIAPPNFTRTKAVRGGCFESPLSECHSACRYPEYPVTVRQTFGFRVCK
ncbi:MAG: formylglycine-generating enzyme family protein [Sphaerospermopsis sp. SIO1G1]|nr:formylglycine-generating enzyme family protein [Sphaerospermopsis sp. SIO1G1]